MTKNVALVLSSGGPRGFAYIGAIEELERRGYKITSIAGTSMGSLIGGIYAAGKLPEARDWFLSLNAWKVFKLMDITVGRNHVVKGEKVIAALECIVPDVKIEDLPIPFCAVATDLFSGDEIVFREGSLFSAIRASISIPALFRPVKYKNTALIDGGIVNSMPLNRIQRNPGDILIGFNVNDIDKEVVHLKVENHAETMANRNGLTGSLRNVLEEEVYGGNYYSLLDRTFDLMNYRNTQLSIRLTPPDILVNMPFDTYGAIADYSKVKEISAQGQRLMAAALDEYETKNNKL